MLPLETQIKYRSASPAGDHPIELKVTFCVRGVVSPILANVYLHYVLDLWFQKKWRARKATGDTIIVRYADDCAPRRRRREAAMAT